MKAWPLILGVLASVVLPLAVQSATLTQKEVIELLQLKTPEAEIIEQIKSGGTKFTLGAEDIARLKRAGATPGDSRGAAGRRRRKRFRRGPEHGGDQRPVPRRGLLRQHE